MPAVGSAKYRRKGPEHTVHPHLTIYVQCSYNYLCYTHWMFVIFLCAGAKKAKVKEVFFSPKIHKHDIDIKLKKIRSWLEEGYR